MRILDHYLVIKGFIWDQISRQKVIFFTFGKKLHLHSQLLSDDFAYNNLIEKPVFQLKIFRRAYHERKL